MGVSEAGVDVVMPAYDALPYLREAVDSVLAQTHGRLTLYLVDDGSTDATPEYASSLDDPRVRYVRQENAGQAAARNRGLALGDAPYVAFLDGDDVWYPHKLEAQLALLEADERVGLVYAHQHVIDERGTVVGEVRNDVRGDAFDALLDRNVVTGSASMVLARRRAFDELGEFRPDLVPAEDWEMWLRLASRWRVDYVPEHLAAIRVVGTGQQQDYARVARAFERMYDAVAAGYPLDRRRRRRLASGTLLPAAIHRALAGQQREARAALVRLARANPASALTGEGAYWYARVLAGTLVPPLRKKAAS